MKKEAGFTFILKENDAKNLIEKYGAQILTAMAEQQQKDWPDTLLLQVPESQIIKNGIITSQPEISVPTVFFIENREFKCWAGEKITLGNDLNHHIAGVENWVASINQRNAGKREPISTLAIQYAISLEHHCKALGGILKKADPYLSGVSTDLQKVQTHLKEIEFWADARYHSRTRLIRSANLHLTFANCVRSELAAVCAASGVYETFDQDLSTLEKAENALRAALNKYRMDSRFGLPNKQKVTRQEIWEAAQKNGYDAKKHRTFYKRYQTHFNTSSYDKTKVPKNEAEEFLDNLCPKN